MHEMNKSGVGLGVSICKKIAYSMNGRLKFTSKLNQGSTFMFQVEVGNWKTDMSPVKKMPSSNFEEFSVAEPKVSMSMDLKP